MKKTFLTILGFSFLGMFSQNKQINIGDLLPKSEASHCVMSNSKHTLNDISKENGLLVIFSCNTCPFVIEWEKEYPSLAKLSTDKKVGIVLVNSNEAKRKGDDSPEEMVKHAKDKGYSNVPYIIDVNNKIADAFGANTTPHVFLFDKNNKLVYKGAIDDRYENKERKVTNSYLKNAILELSNNKPIHLSETVNKGCSIKRI